MIRILCLCPTYGRPRHLIENTIACFESQMHQDRFLLILDDLGNIGEQQGDRWAVVSGNIRYPHLPAKYHAMLEMADCFYHDWNAVVPWDDDDIYLETHLAAHAAILGNMQWSHPSLVWSTYSGSPLVESAAGRFYASCAVRRELLESFGGWQSTLRADFDQWFLRDCAIRAQSGDPVGVFGFPTFVFRWMDTGAPHAQSVIRSPVDTAWYGRIPATNSQAMSGLKGTFDAAARNVRHQIRATILEVAKHGDCRQEALHIPECQPTPANHLR